MNFVCPTALESQSEKAGEGELALLHSELWSSLFRGGYRVGKLQRSLSGYYVSLYTFITYATMYPTGFILYSFKDTFKASLNAFNNGHDKRELTATDQSGV